MTRSTTTIGMFLCHSLLLATFGFHYVLIGAQAQQLTTVPATPTALASATGSGSAAVTSLYIPGFDPQPVSADVLGVDGEGRTTWALHRGSATGTDTDVGGFLGTATLVEGAKDASLTYANAEASFTIGMQCAFTDSTLAVCTIVAQESTATQTEVIQSQPIQGGSTLAATTTPTSGTPSSTATTTNSGSNASISTTSSGTSTSSTTTGAGDASNTISPTTSSNAAGSSGRKRGSAALWSVGLAIPYLILGQQLV